MNIEDILLFGIPGILLLVLIYFMIFKKSSDDNQNLRSSCWGVGAEDDGKEACETQRSKNEKGFICEVCKTFEHSGGTEKITCCEKSE